MDACRGAKIVHPTQRQDNAIIRPRTLVICLAIIVACIRREGRTELQPLAHAAMDGSDRIVVTTVGGEHACAISSRDVAYCWGKADGWLLGTDDTASAVRVAGDHRFTS